MANYDDALKNSVKNLQMLEPYQFNPLLWTHMSTSNYLFSVGNINIDVGINENDKSFISNNNLWEAVFYNKLRRRDIKVKLESFFLFEWFPRSPGLYHTDIAKHARNEASKRIIKVENGIVVYDPYGKQSMLDGGVGNIRLKPITLNGTEYFFMSASSNGTCHEGFPVAVPAFFYNKVIDEIVTKGAVVKTLTGKIKNIPDALDQIYHGNREVPKFYLEIEDIAMPQYPQSRHMEDLEITIASSFVSAYEGPPKIYATYVTFDPAKQKSFKEMVRWMEDEYVEGRYKGKVITDFDETMSHFDNAAFSLKKVMNFEVQAKDQIDLFNQLGIDYRGIFQYQNDVKKLLQLKDADLKNQNKVFISYNHADQETALQVKAFLESEGLEVIIDKEAMKTGEKIESFIINCIRTSGMTLSIVSKKSLISAWVAMETVYSRFDEDIRDRKFLPVNVDNDFLNTDFVDEALVNVKKELNKNNKMRSKRILDNYGTEDLDVQITRLRDLIHGMPTLIKKLRGSLCVDISQNNFSTGMQKVVTDIKSYLI